MYFETAKETAERLQLNVRTIQKWAKEGRIHGAKRMGKSWMIPKSFEGVNSQRRTVSIMMPLLNSRFEAGHCLETIEKIENPDLQAIACGEYYYFSGQPEKAIDTVEPYLQHEDTGLAVSANIIYSFAAVALGTIGQRIYLKGNVDEIVQPNIDRILKEDQDGIFAAGLSLCKHIGQVLMQISVHEDPIRERLYVLPEGFRFFGVYVMAYDAYLKGLYRRALGIVEAGLGLMADNYPVARVFLLLIQAASEASLRRMDDAKHTLFTAWDLAKKDGFVEPFAYHYTLLHGVVEVVLKKEDPEGFENIVKAATRFKKGWEFYHQKAVDKMLADMLTTTELSVAMLYAKGWSVKEIAGHMENSDRMVKHHLTVTYEKLGISSRDELRIYIMPEYTGADAELTE
ncbi:MAG: helix-turn-helix domain-containing protein [Firmicutes bacterium]|nr:helix-turn-helix domain-containing protein [Bacillota bacterium]